MKWNKFSTRELTQEEREFFTENVNLFGKTLYQTLMKQFWLATAKQSGRKIGLSMRKV